MLLLVWAVASYLAVRGGVEDANARLPEAVEASLAPQDGLLLSNPTTILLLGTDGDRRPQRAQASRRSDSIMLVRTDPKRHRIAYLSIPRDLRVDVPGLRADEDQRRLPARRPGARRCGRSQALTGLRSTTSRSSTSTASRS